MHLSDSAFADHVPTSKHPGHSRPREAQPKCARTPTLRRAPPVTLHLFHSCLPCTSRHSTTKAHRHMRKRRRPI
ncbi:hypothetical protein K523DRAFT_322854 [Schizophyllum commune Tattone D]|nr:hypothetical protein K523DRAFT_322854 [Schizophyllum commune Tattone D]